MKTIGVVAGVGPLAGVDFQRKIIAQTRASGDRDHLDVVAVSSPAGIPDRTDFLLGRESRNPAGPLARQLALLEQAGAAIGAIPCNTAHAPPIFEPLRSEMTRLGISLKLLNMVEETLDWLAGLLPAGAGVGALCTLGGYRVGHYENALRRRGFSAVIPGADGQQAVHDTVYSTTLGVKARGPTAAARQTLLEVIARLKDRGADAVILGCTELPLLVTETRVAEIAVVDPALVLARAAIREAAPEKLLPWPGEKS